MNLYKEYSLEKFQKEVFHKAMVKNFYKTFYFLGLTLIACKK